jgi:hypothetical protein
MVLEKAGDQLSVRKEELPELERKIISYVQ